MNLLLSIHPTLATSLPTSAPILTCLLCSNLWRPFESKIEERKWKTYFYAKFDDIIKYRYRYSDFFVSLQY